MEVLTINTRVLFSRCALAAALIMIAGACSAVNLVQNPGFETWGPANNIPNWTYWKSDWGSSSSTTECTTETKINGSYALKLSTKFASFGVYQQIPVTPGRAYQMNGWWKGTYPTQYDCWYDCELLIGPFVLKTADERPDDLPFKVCTYDYAEAIWDWERMSDAYYTTLELSSLIPASQVCRNGIKIAGSNIMTVVLKTGTVNNNQQAIGYYDDISVEEVPTMSVVQTRTQPDFKAVMLEGAKVTAVFPDCIYVQSPDRISGIKIAKNYPYNAYVGQNAKIAGVLRTDSVGDRYIETSYIVCTGTPTTIKPIAMAVKSLSTVTNGSRPNTLGLLVRISGSVRYIDSHTFMIDDGSGSEVKCETPANVTVSPAWTFASVTGISACYKEGETHKKLVRIRQSSDIVSVTQ